MSRRLRAIPAQILMVLLFAAPAMATTYYVRQTVGDDAHDGRTPATAWRSIVKLSTALRAGDTVYVGPGLYREQVTVGADGTADARVVFIADPTGDRTGDPPGTVMITGADPADESIFEPAGPPGVYRAVMPQRVLGAVEMDGPQRRYRRARDTTEHLVEKLAEPDVVGKLPSSYWYDEDHHTLLLHTSDGREPRTHELELIHRGDGILVTGKHFVSIFGFTFRHFGDAGISFFKESGDLVAIGNVSWGGRQGIRVYGATNVLAQGNTLFRNDNSGIYFAAQSTGGVAIGNTTYENVKGLRWSSQSSYPIVLDNLVFDNDEAGIALENVDGAYLRRNRFIRNRKAQLFTLRSAYDADDACFEGPSELVADFVFGDHYSTLDAYQHAKRADLHSRAGDCGAPPPSVDVHRLHVETTEYTARAHALLASAPSPSPERTHAPAAVPSPSPPRSPRPTGRATPIIYDLSAPSASD